MTNFWKCFGFLTVLGVVSHFFGQALPRRFFIAERAPWRDAPWERGGRVYEKLHVRVWMNYMPDMSRIMPDMVPKKLTGQARTQEVDTLIRETCVAELIHALLGLFGFVCVFIWEGAGGWAVSCVYAVGNVPFIVIQRYNRPRLVRLHRWLLQREQRSADMAKLLGEREVDE